MVHVVFIICAVSIVSLLFGTILQIVARERLEPSWRTSFLVHLAFLLAALLVYATQFFAFVYLREQHPVFDTVLYYLCGALQAGILLTVPALYLKAVGLAPTRSQTAVVISLAVLVLASAFFGDLIEPPFVRRAVRALPYAALSAVFLVGYRLIASNSHVRHSQFLSRFFFYSGIAYAVVTIDAVAIRFSLSTEEYVPDGMTTLPIYAIAIGIVLSRTAMLRMRSGNAEFAVTGEFVSEHDITQRELDIINCLLKGYTNNQISEELFISPRTVDTHFSNIYRKCNVRSRLELVKLISDYG